MRNRRWICLLLAALMVLACTACGTKANNDASGDVRTLTDGKNRTVEVPKQVERVVCVGVGALRYSCYVGAADRAVGVEDYETKAGMSRLYNYVNFDKFKDLPVTGTNGEPYVEQIIDVAKHVQADGAAVLRGGAWKPSSSPYSFQGLKAEGLELLHKAHEATGLPVVTEITNPAHIDIFMDKCDCFQVGARNMQNFELLKELGQTRKPILLKRGFANTMEEFLMSAEYIMAGGNENVILCERGIRTYEKYTRNTLDISAVPVLKRMSHLPVVVDPSHAGGIYWMVEPLAKAAVAAGADGLMIEVHNDPAHALSDGAQSLTYDSFHHTMNALRAVAAAVDREI